MDIPKNPKPNKSNKNGYEGIISTNHFKFMEINDHVDLLFPSYFVAILLSICGILGHFHPLCIHISNSANDILKVFILLNVYVGVAWDAPYAPRLDAQGL